MGEPGIYAARHELPRRVRIHRQPMPAEVELHHARDHERQPGDSGTGGEGGNTGDGPRQGAARQDCSDAEDPWKHGHKQGSVHDPADHGGGTRFGYHRTSSKMSVASSSAPSTL